MLKYFLFAFLLLTNLPYNIFAQTTLTLDEAIKMALGSNLSLKKTEIDLAASAFSVKNLWSEFFPSINVSAGVGYHNSLFSSSPPNMKNTSNNFSIGLSLNLNAGIPYAIKSIQMAHQSNILRYDDARSQLSIQITKRFYSLIAEKDNLLLLEEVFNLAQRQHTRSESLFRNGMTSEMSLMQSLLAMENARYSHAAAQITHDINMAEFLAMIGMSTNEEITLSGEINIVRIDVDAEALIREYLPFRPDIVSAAQEIERLRNSHIQTSMQSRAPSVNLSLNWSSGFNPFSDSFSANANVSIPVDSWIPGTSRNQSISRSEDLIEKARLDLIMAENTARTQIRSFSAMLRNSWESIRIARLSYELASRNYNLTEQAFLFGVIDVFALEDSRNNMASARQRLLQAELSYFNTILDLSAALNINWKRLVQLYGREE